MLHKEMHSKIRTMKYLFHLITLGGGQGSNTNTQSKKDTVKQYEQYYPLEKQFDQMFQD